MTTDDLLREDCADDAEEVLVAWLEPLRRCAAVRKSGEDLPFTLVHHIDGNERPDEMAVDDVVSVKTLCARADGVAAAADECKLTHRRMLKLGKELPAIDLLDGRQASVDYLEVVPGERPHWEFYSDDILCKVARYRIGLSYVDQDPVDDGS